MENKEKSKISFTEVKQILQMAFGQSKRKLLFTIVIFLTAGIITPIVRPMVIQSVFNAVETGGRAQLLMSMVFGGTFTLINGILMYILLVHLDTWADSIIQESNIAALGICMKKPFGLLEEYEEGDLFNRINTMSGSSLQLILFPVRFVARIAVCLFLGIQMLAFKWYFWIILSAVLVVTILISRKQASYEKAIQEQLELTYGKREELLRIIVMDDAFYRQVGMTDVILGKYRDNRRKMFGLICRRTVGTGIYNAISEAVMLLGKVAVLIMAYPLRLAEQLTAGVLSASFMIYEKMLEQLTKLQKNVVAYSRFFIPLMRFVEISGLPEEKAREGEGMDILMLQNVSVSLGGKQILKDISVSIRRGEKVAVVGENGSGKTTLLRVMLGMYEGRHEGNVYWGKELSGAGKISYIPVRTQLFQESVQNNREMGAVGTLKEEPAILKEIYEEIKAKNKDMLSEGQRQIVNILRAWEIDGILFGDEVTGSLAPEIREGVVEALVEKYETAVMIVHDTSLLRHFDRIIRIEDGRMVGNS